MNRKTIVLAALPPAVLAIAGALYFTLAPAFEKAAVAPVAPPAVPVVAGVVSSHDVPIYLRGVGTVIAYNNDVVRSQITGPAHPDHLHRRADRQSGDLLAQIDPRPYQAQLDQMTANRDRDQAQLVNAIANLDRYTELQSKGFATPQLFDTQKAQVAQLQATVKADEALIEQAEVQLELHAADVADRRRHRHPADRRRQHHSSDRSQRPGRRHADRADLADLHAAASRSCRRSRRKWPKGR